MIYRVDEGENAREWLDFRDHDQVGGLRWVLETVVNCGATPLIGDCVADANWFTGRVLVKFVESESIRESLVKEIPNSCLEGPQKEWKSNTMINCANPSPVLGDYLIEVEGRRPCPDSHDGNKAIFTRSQPVQIEVLRRLAKRQANVTVYKAVDFRGGYDDEPAMRIGIVVRWAPGESVGEMVRDLAGWCDDHGYRLNVLDLVRGFRIWPPIIGDQAA